MDSYNKICMIIRKTDLLNHDEKDELHLYLMNLKDQVKKQKELINKVGKILNECKLLMPHEFDWQEQVDYVLDILKEVSE